MSDGKDFVKLGAEIATGNYIKAAGTALKNKKTRKILLIMLLPGFLFTTMPLLLLSAASISSIMTRPVENFKPKQIQQIKDQANAWESTIKWISGYDKKGNPIWTTGLSDDEIQQVNDEGVNLAWGLVAALKEFGAKDTAQVAKALSPTHIEFEKAEKFTRVYEVKDGQEKLISKSESKHYVMSQIVTYNGTHNFSLVSFTTTTYQTLSDGHAVGLNGGGFVLGNPDGVGDGQTVIKTVVTDEKIGGDNWTKDYNRLYAVEKPLGITKDLEDQSLLFRQAMLLDPTFGDPLANPILNEIIGGMADVSSFKNVPLPPAEITNDLKQAIKIVGVNESEWLPGLQKLVMIESGGNPHAVAKKTAWYSAAWGYQRAEGLLQTMPPTFFEYKLPGHEDIWNPVDNAIASIRYIQAHPEYGRSVQGALAEESKGGY